MSEPFGSKEWCLWCKGTEMSKLRELKFIQKRGTAGETVFVCSEGCEREVNKAMELVQKGIPIFIGGLIAMIVLMVLGFILGFAVYFPLLSITGVGLMIFGGIIMAYPMVTPDTISLMGLKKGFMVGRIGGIVLFVMGIGTGVLVFVAPPPS